MANGTIKRQEGISLSSNNQAWPGTSLSFNISPSNVKMYEFSALSANGEGVKALIAVRVDPLVRLCNFGSSQISAAYSNGILTITLPSSNYWTYNMVELDSRN